MESCDKWESKRVGEKERSGRVIVRGWESERVNKLESEIIRDWEHDGKRIREWESKRVRVRDW